MKEIQGNYNIGTLLVQTAGGYCTNFKRSDQLYSVTRGTESCAHCDRL
jgi:hypothetical protein